MTIRLTDSNRKTVDMGIKPTTFGLLPLFPLLAKLSSVLPRNLLNNPSGPLASARPALGLPTHCLLASSSFCTILRRPQVLKPWWWAAGAPRVTMSYVLSEGSEEQGQTTRVDTECTTRHILVPYYA